MRPDTQFFPQLTLLASCLCGEIQRAGLPEPCFCGVLAGETVPLDYCTPCEDRCGMAWVRLTTITSVTSVAPTTFGAGTGGGGGCGSLEAIVEVGITRCAPGLDADGNMPTMAEQFDAASLNAADMAAGLRAIKCCFTNSRDYSVISWQPIGPTGGCMGGVWTVTVYEGGM